MKTHGTPAFEREQRQRRLHRQFIFASEGAAGRARHHPDAILGNGKNARELHAVARAVLAADANRESAVGLRHHIASFGFHEGVHLARRDIGILDDMRALVPSRVDVAACEVHLALKIAGRMHQRRAGRERTLHVVDHRQRLIFDADQGERPLGRLLVHRRNRRDRFAGVTHFIGAQGRLILDDDAVSVLPLDIPRGHHGDDAW